MHTNFNLNFNHKIKFFVYHDHAPVIVQIQFNNRIVYEQSYAGGVEHCEKLNFDSEVINGQKNNIQFRFTGDKESSKKYLKVTDITVQKYKIPVLKNYYEPEINSQWWNNLSKEKQKHFKKIIYINNNGHFGWYGNIEYEYYSALDRNTAYLCDEAAVDRITHNGNRFVYNSLNTVNLPWWIDESKN